MNPLKVGAALMVEDLPTYRDWLIADQRDLEIQSFHFHDVLLGDWQSLVDVAKRHLDGFEGRLGIHGPFYNVPMDGNDPEIRPVITRRYMLALDVCEALGATQMVVHSPYSTWDYNNFSNNPGGGNKRSARQEKIEKVHAVMGEVVRRAGDIGVTLVIENIEDIDPADRRELAESFDSDAVKLSIDTGHAEYAHGSTGAPPVDYYVVDAGNRLDHVHLQDADGYADRHWAPGRGTIRWHQVFAAIAALDVSPRLVLELRDAADIPAAMSYLEGEGLAR